MSEWETFCDNSYFDLWRVRRKNERGFDDGYHLQHGAEAKELMELLNRLERERDEARAILSEIANARQLKCAVCTPEQRCWECADDTSMKAGANETDTKALRMTNHACKLKRERNEAREQRDRLAEIAKQFVSILDITEQSDGGRLFHPTNITSCRAGDLQKIGELVEALRRASKTDRIIRNAEIAELEQLKEGAK